ncbi:hypothetical protein NHG25_01115 [Aerococcaceae bacterium NML191292]|nr:hypothetical protein [Aerococcaceae bacterium NML191292]
MQKIILSLCILFIFPVAVFAQEQEDEETTNETFYYSYYMEDYEPYNPELVQVNDPDFIAVCNEISALRPIVEDAFARARYKIAEDDLDEYQSALRRIEHAERYEWYEGQDAIANAYENLHHVLGVIARLEALNTPKIEDSKSVVSSITPAEQNASAPSINEFTQNLFEQLLNHLKTQPLQIIRLTRPHQPLHVLIWFIELLGI